MQETNPAWFILPSHHIQFLLRPLLKPRSIHRPPFLTSDSRFPLSWHPTPSPTQTHRHAQASRQLLHCLTHFHLFQSWRENSCFRITPEWRTKLLPPRGCLCFPCLDWEGDFSTGKENKVVAVCFYFVWSFVFLFFFFLFLGGEIFSLTLALT